MSEESKSFKSNSKRIIKEYTISLIIAVVIAFCIKATVVQASKIQGSSMEPTLLDGDQLMVNKFIYGIKNPFSDKTLIPVSNPERGDIIVFRAPGDKDVDYVKRVIALPGEKVEIREREIYIDDHLYQDPHASYVINNRLRKRYSLIDDFGPATVPEHSVFCLGDNRDQSSDSRHWGFLNMDNIHGKAVFIHFSWDEKTESLFNKVRWVRLGKTFSK